MRQNTTSPTAAMITTPIERRGKSPEMTSDTAITDPATRAIDMTMMPAQRRPLMGRGYRWAPPGSNRRHPQCQASLEQAEIHPTEVVSLMT